MSLLMITMLFSSALTSFFTVQDDFVLLTWDYPLYLARIWGALCSAQLVYGQDGWISIQNKLALW